MTFARTKVLLSDSPSLLFAVRESILQTSQVSPLITSEPAEVMALFRMWKPDLAILGPDEIISLCQTLKSSREFRDTPLISLIEGNDHDLRDKTLESGTDDWIPTPLDETLLLSKVQDLVALRFRKLPRYSHGAPALVSFKGKEFPSKSIDINRRMIFLESKEGLAPATGRNVKVRFQLTKEESMTCWGRVEKLMARKVPQEERETIGMLIRFLDLPPNAARRIDTLAQQQMERFVPVEPAGETARNVEWCESKFYQEQARNQLLQKPVEADTKMLLPLGVLKAYVDGLSPQEKNTLLEQDGNEVLRETIGLRIRLMDELTKWKRGADLERAQDTLAGVERTELLLQEQLKEAVEKNDSSMVLLWSKIKYEVIRTKIEIQFLRGQSTPFARSLAAAEEQKSLNPDPDRKTLTFLALLIVSLILNFIFFFRTCG